MEWQDSVRNKYGKSGYETFARVSVVRSRRRSCFWEELARPEIALVFWEARILVVILGLAQRYQVYGSLLLCLRHTKVPIVATRPSMYDSIHRLLVIVIATDMVLYHFLLFSAIIL